MYREKKRNLTGGTKEKTTVDFNSFDDISLIQNSEYQQILSFRSLKLILNSSESSAYYILNESFDILTVNFSSLLACSQELH